MDSPSGDVEALARAAGLTVSAEEIERLRATLERSRAAMTGLRAAIGAADEPAARFVPAVADHDRR